MISEIKMLFLKIKFTVITPTKDRHVTRIMSTASLGSQGLSASFLLYYHCYALV